MSRSVRILSRDGAVDAGFAGFNGGNHYCIDLPNDPATISVRTPDGNLITFAFVLRPADVGHQCVDIVHHSLTRDKSGNPLQTTAFLGAGPVVAVTKPTDNTPTTIVALNLPAN